ncbi:g406 [Coccomyxa elongata]
MAQFDHLATYSDCKRPGITRLVFTKRDVEARAYIKDLMRQAGLSVREDVMGNTFGRWEGSDSKAGTVMTGSHSDTVVLGGPYDGALGSLGAIAAIHALRKLGFKPSKSIEAVMFTTEEASRFSIPCLGSQGMTGFLEPEVLDTFKDENGTSFVEAANAAGFSAGTSKEYAEKALLKNPSDIAAFVELHIEQGPALEAEGKDIGIVEAIMAPSLVRIKFTGKGGHGGGMPMSYRNDPSLAASELALRIEEAALATGAAETVATVGLWDQQPNIYNAVPRSVLLDIDIRDSDKARRDGVIKATLDAAEEIAQKRKCGHTKELKFEYPVATSDKKVLEAIQVAADLVGAKSKRMISRAYHDAAFMAQIAPTAMIFVPSKDGLSHHPNEHTAPEDLARGVQVLALTLAQLSGPSSAMPTDKGEL